MHSKGFSFFELLITLAILTILATLAFPNYQTFMNNANSQTMRSNLQRMLALARSEAMLRGVTVTLCGAGKNQQCAPAWNAGILVFTDPTQILYKITTHPKAGNLHWRSSFKLNYLQIQPTGTTNGTNGTFWYCPRKNQAPSWALIVSLSGRARLLENTKEFKNLNC